MSVYFVQAGDGGRIKIGYSPSPNQRVAYLRRYSGPDLFELAVIDGSGQLEKKYISFCQGIASTTNGSSLRQKYWQSSVARRCSKRTTTSNIVECT